VDDCAYSKIWVLERGNDREMESLLTNYVTNSDTAIGIDYIKVLALLLNMILSNFYIIPINQTFHEGCSRKFRFRFYPPFHPSF